MFRILGCVDALNERMSSKPHPPRHKLDLQPPPPNRVGVLPKFWVPRSQAHPIPSRFQQRPEKGAF